MKLFLISQTVNVGYDTFDSAVVAAPNEEAAALMYPGDGESILTYAYATNSWVKDPKLVTVKYIGQAARGTKAGVICSSFNAG